MHCIRRNALSNLQPSVKEQWKFGRGCQWTDSLICLNQNRSSWRRHRPLTARMWMQVSLRRVFSRDTRTCTSSRSRASAFLLVMRCGMRLTATSCTRPRRPLNTCGRPRLASVRPPRFPPDAEAEATSHAPERFWCTRTTRQQSDLMCGRRRLVVIRGTRLSAPSPHLPEGAVSKQPVAAICCFADLNLRRQHHPRKRGLRARRGLCHHIGSCCAGGGQLSRAATQNGRHLATRYAVSTQGGRLYSLRHECALSALLTTWPFVTQLV